MLSTIIDIMQADKYMKLSMETKFDKRKNQQGKGIGQRANNKM